MAVEKIISLASQGVLDRERDGAVSAVPGSAPVASSSPNRLFANEGLSVGTVLSSRPDFFFRSTF